MNEKLLDEILSDKDKEKVEIQATEDEIQVTWLIFSMHEKLYAIVASSVKEILRNLELYPLPFLPNYFSGVVNRHGDPYAVVDGSLIIGEEKQDSALYAVLNIPNEQLCLRISSIVDFYVASSSSVTPFSDGEEFSCFSGFVSYHKESVPVFNITSLYDKIKGNINGMQ